MTDYLMPMPAEVRALLDATAEVMAAKFGITRGEAVARMNAKWEGLEFREDDLLLHEDENFWAMQVYYADVPDWSPDADRSTWTPVPPPHDPRFWTAGP